MIEVGLARADERQKCVNHTTVNVTVIVRCHPQAQTVEMLTLAPVALRERVRETAF